MHKGKRHDATLITSPRCFSGDQVGAAPSAPKKGERRRASDPPGSDRWDLLMSSSSPAEPFRWDR